MASAAAQAAFAVSYAQLFSLITWTGLGLMSATAAVAGQNLGARHPDRAEHAVAAAARIALHPHQFPGTFCDHNVAQPGDVIAMLDSSGKQLLEALPHRFLPSVGAGVTHRRHCG